MKHVHYDEVEALPVDADGADGVQVRWLISPDDGAPNFSMRRFEVEPGGMTPHHTHPWEHEIYVLEGEGLARYGGREHPFRAGDCLYVPPGEKHCFVAGASAHVAFLCLVPNDAVK